MPELSYKGNEGWLVVDVKNSDEVTERTLVTKRLCTITARTVYELFVTLSGCLGGRIGRNEAKPRVACKLAWANFVPEGYMHRLGDVPAYIEVDGGEGGRPPAYGEVVASSGSSDSSS